MPLVTLSLKLCMLFFIQTLPRILCVGDISRVFLGLVWTDCWGNKSDYDITSPANTVHYSRDELLSLANVSRKMRIPNETYSTLKDLGIFRYRSRRAGSKMRRKSSNWNCATFSESPLDNIQNHILVHISYSYSASLRENLRTSNCSNLRSIPHSSPFDNRQV